jgi:diphthamide synthase (EF-2-diphthine--ammonia ligase)
VSIGEPTADRNSMLGMEDIRGGRIVDDDSILEIPSDLGQVFDVIALVVVAALAEKSVMHHVVDVKLIQERVAILQH